MPKKKKKWWVIEVVRDTEMIKWKKPGGARTRGRLRLNINMVG